MPDGPVGRHDEPDALVTHGNGPLRVEASIKTSGKRGIPAFEGDGVIDDIAHADVVEQHERGELAVEHVPVQVAFLLDDFHGLGTEAVLHNAVTDDAHVMEDNFFVGRVVNPADARA